jgi:hypothetical protein
LLEPVGDAVSVEDACIRLAVGQDHDPMQSSIRGPTLNDLENLRKPLGGGTRSPSLMAGVWDAALRYEVVDLVEVVSGLKQGEDMAASAHVGLDLEAGHKDDLMVILARQTPGGGP